MRFNERSSTISNQRYNPTHPLQRMDDRADSRSSPPIGHTLSLYLPKYSQCQFHPGIYRRSRYRCAYSGRIYLRMHAGKLRGNTEIIRSISSSAGYLQRHMSLREAWKPSLRTERSLNGYPKTPMGRLIKDKYECKSIWCFNDRFAGPQKHVG